MEPLLGIKTVLLEPNRLPTSRRSKECKLLSLLVSHAVTKTYGSALKVFEFRFLHTGVDPVTGLKFEFYSNMYVLKETESNFRGTKYQLETLLSDCNIKQLVGKAKSMKQLFNHMRPLPHHYMETIYE